MPSNLNKFVYSCPRCRIHCSIFTEHYLSDDIPESLPFEAIGGEIYCKKCGHHVCSNYLLLRYPSLNLIKLIHLSMKVDLDGFISESSLEFIEDTVLDYPESLSVSVTGKIEKVSWVAAYYLFHLIKNHPFGDGNKRTAFFTLMIFLIKNNVISTYDESLVSKQLEKINTAIAKGAKVMSVLGKVGIKIKQTPEYKIILLMFQLAGADISKNYSSPQEIQPKIREFIADIRKVKSLPKSKVKFYSDFLDGLDKKMH